MSLGVLNNLNAMYAENNLNNTSNSLNTVLQQLSSGSKINSGADDAAGLSLVDGLQANSQALAQSQTNASEGVGLLKVADGALSQVTNLLNRAVTLATEASNGTLNSSQDAAANSEYQSILSEINNIGATTTYNNQTVFGGGSPVSIYTGDSSTAGASVDALNIGSLSSANVGDTGGVMAYSNGSDNVFLNLSSSTANAKVTDNLSGTTSTMTVNYLVQGGNGASTTATTNIVVGQGTSYANNAQGLINAINNSGLGLSASFTTQANAGVQGGGTQTGIQITGGLVSAGIDPGSSSTSGTLNMSGLAANATLAQGATVSIAVGSGAATTFTIGASNNTLATLAHAIQIAGIGVNANVITNGDGTQSLNLADSTTGGGALTVTTGAGTTQAPTFSTGVAGTTQNIQTQGTDTLGTKAVTAVNSTVTVGTGNGGELYSDQLTAGSSITITNTNPAAASQILTFTVGKGTDNTAPNLNTYYTGNQDSGTGGDTLGNLADTINAKSSTLGVYATVTSSGLQLNTGTWTGGNYVSSGASTTIAATQTDLTGENVTATSTLSSATSGTKLNLYSPSVGGVAGGGQPEIMAFSATNAGAAVAAVAGNTLTGTFQITGSQGSYSFTAGPTDTYTTLVANINNANIGVSASFNTSLDGSGNGGLELTSTDSTNVMSVTNGLTDSTAGHALTQNTVSVVDFGTGVANATTDSLVGGAAGHFAIVGSGGTFTSTGADSTIGNLATDISASAGKNLTATFNQSLNGGNGGLLIIDSGVGAADNLSVATMTDTQAGAGTPTSNAASGNGTQQVEGLSLAAGGGAEGDFLSGSVQVVGPHGAYTFTGNGTSTSYDTLVTDINNANIGVTAAYSASVGGSGDKGIVLTGSDTSNVIAFNNNSLVDSTDASAAVATLHTIATGNNKTNVATASTAVLQLTGQNISDSGSTLNGAIQIAYHGTSQIFVMGTDPGSTSAEHVTNAIYTGGNTVQSLVNAINSTQTDGQTNNLNSAGVTFQASAPGGGTGGIYLQGMAGNTSAITLTAIDPTASNGISTPLSVTNAMTAGTATNGLTGVTGIDAADNITTGGTTIATSDTVAGSITVTNGGNNIGIDSGTNGAVGLPTVNNVYAAGSTSEQDQLTSGTTFSFTTHAGNTFNYTAAAGDTWQTLVSAINSSATVGSGVSTGVTASWSASAGGASNGGIVLTNNYNGSTNITINAGTLTDQSLNNITALSTSHTLGESVQAGAGGAPTINGFRGGTTDLETDTLTADSSATFAVDGESYTYTAAHAGTDTWQTLITDINQSSIGTANPYGVTASWSATGGGAGDPGMVLTNNWNGANTVTYTQGGINLKDFTANTTVGDTVTQAGGGTPTVSALDSGAAAVSTDSLTGSMTMTVGAHAYTYTAAAGDNWQNLVSDINSSAIGTADNSGVTASWNANAGGTGIGGIVLTGNETGANPVAITGNSLVDQASAVTDTFTVGVGHNTSNQFYTQADNGTNHANNLSGLADLVSAQSSTLHVSAQANSSGLTLTQTAANGGSIATSANSLTDVTAGTYNKATSTELASENDNLSGSLVFTVAGNSKSVNMSDLTDKSVSGLISYITQNSSTLGVSAAWVPSAGPNANFGSIQLTSGTQGSTGTVTVNASLTSLTDTTTGSALSYTSGAAYNTGISASVVDSTTSQASAAQLTSQSLNGSGIATISYTHGAGQSLSATTLTNSTEAKASLTALNAAITDVASQDGYIGAQINTLNSVSSVLATQQQNVVAAQNAVQATDYASAASNMSKYEILSQTGISALAQANSMQQEVTKLLQ